MPPGLGPDDYQPRILGSGRSSQVPVTEIVIVGRDQVEALTRLLEAFRAHKVELLGLESQSLPGTKLFVITAYTDMASADLPLEKLLALLRRILAVQSARGVELDPSNYDRFLFPVVAVDGSRLVISTAESLAQVEKYFSKLPEDTGTLLLFATGRQSGLALVRALRRSHPGEFQSQMLGHAVDELRTSGWGLFSIDISLMEAGMVKVSVKSPVITDVAGATESWMTYGLCAGVIEGIYGMVGIVSDHRSYSDASNQLKFKLVELTPDQRIKGIGR